MPRHDGRRTRRMRVLLSANDLEEIGRRLVEARGSVRFMADRSPAVLRTMPRDAAVIVAVLDAVVSPGLDRPIPDVGGAADGMQVSIVTSTITPDQDMQVGEVNCLLDPDDPEHLAFWDAVARVVRAVTRPHVTFIDGGRVNVRVGTDAEAWFWADDRHGFLDGPYTRYRLRERRG